MKGMISLKLEWFGHACFRLEAKNGSVVFDPYADGAVPGLHLPSLSADRVICSHCHSDHNAADKVCLTGAEKTGLAIRQLRCFHDDVCGNKRGENMISIVSAEGLSVAHMGDIGHLLTDKQYDELGLIDILLVPVGGVYTVDADEAYKLARRIRPRIVVPMHYRLGDRGLQNVADATAFLRHFDEKDIHRVGTVWDTVNDPISSGVLVFTAPAT